MSKQTRVIAIHKLCRTYISFMNSTHNSSISKPFTICLINANRIAGWFAIDGTLGRSYCEYSLKSDNSYN